MRNDMVVIGALLVILTATAHAAEWEPWAVPGGPPVVEKQAKSMKPTASPKQESLLVTPFLGLLRFYQLYISPLDGDRCPLYPTCSGYSVQAIRRHGPLVGIVMTADRLMHEADERKTATEAMVGTRMRYLDSLDDNDFWWYQQ